MQKQYRGSCYLSDEEEKQIKLEYFLISENKLFYEETNPRVTYGIEIVKDDTEFEMVRDVSINRNRINDVIDLLKNNGVLPIHLYDIINDLL